MLLNLTNDAPPEAEADYAALCNPKLGHLLKIFQMDYAYTRAADNRLYAVRDGRQVEVIDCVGGYGSTILGHNAKVVVDELTRALTCMVPSHAQGSVHRPASRLAHLLNREVRAGFDAPELTYIVQLVNTGTEASEAAIKHALMAWQERRATCVHLIRRERSRLMARGAPESVLAAVDAAIAATQGLAPQFIALTNGFHGKTAGSLAVTNPAYGKMYDRPAPQCCFLDPHASTADIEAVFARHTLHFGEGRAFCAVAGAIIEVIQGEAGIRPVPHAFVQGLAQACKASGALFIVDEVQTGMYRTGAFLASERYGIVPDCITLGKALGGGITKVAAVLIERSKYCNDFGTAHTSTFAEDDLSALVACKTIEHLATRQPPVRVLADAFCKRMLDGIDAMRRRYPGVVKEARGSGFFIGIEFFSERPDRGSAFFSALAGSGYLASFLASYLLNQHSIRVAATLGNPNTVRIEPALTMTEADVSSILTALEQMIGHLHAGQYLALSSHLWPDPDPGTGTGTDTDTDTMSSLGPSLEPVMHDVPQIAFLTHLVDSSALAAIDPIFRDMSPANTEYFAENMAPLMKEFPLHRQTLQASDGSRVQLTLWALATDSRFFEDSLRRGSPDACNVVMKMAASAKAAGASYLGLGQYTSIVTNNGLDLVDLGIPITTGNSYTVGSSFLLMQQAMAAQGVPKAPRIGIVGAVGNIGRVMAELATDIAGELLIVHREDLNKSPKFEAAREKIAKQAPATCRRVVADHRLESLATCDVVVVCTNSSRPFIHSEHIKPGAIVMDISVPSALDDSFASRDDICLLYGGTIRLPLDQKLRHPSFGFVRGEVFACMAETLMAGFMAASSSFSVGPLMKSRVLESIDLAERFGFTLGDSRNRYLKRR